MIRKEFGTRQAPFLFGHPPTPHKNVSEHKVLILADFHSPNEAFVSYIWKTHFEEDYEKEIAMHHRV